MPPEVTAVITTHVRPDRLYAALASVRSETHKDMEVVIVDDGGGLAAPASYGDLPVRILRGAGLGVGRARNVGLAAAQGEYIIFLDDDDVAMPLRIARLLSVAKEKQATLCFGMTRRVTDDDGDPLGEVPTHLSADGAVGFCDLITCAPHVNSVLVRTEALRAVGGFDAGADHFDDWSAWLRIADGGALMWCISDTVAEWRIHEHGLSGQVMGSRAMKTRLIALLERLRLCLSTENARAVAAVLRVVQLARIITYDDYADTMALARAALHAGGDCFGPSLCAHRQLR